MREIHLVSAEFEAPIVLEGASATLENVVQILPRATIFHFAGHALASTAQSGLVFSHQPNTPPEQQLLTADRIRSLHLNKPKLAVLSACSTGQSEHSDLSDANSLARALLSAGFGQVVATRWNVDSVATADLIGVFYAALLSGKPVPMALQAAAIRIRDTPATGHPYYWAAFETLMKN